MFWSTPQLVHTGIALPVLPSSGYAAMAAWEWPGIAISGTIVPKRAPAAAPPREPGRVLDRNRGDAPYDTGRLRLPEDRGREELPQCLEPVERARRAVGSNRDVRRAGIEPIAFVAEAGEGGVEAEGDDRRSRGRGAAHGEPQTGGREEIVAQQLAQPSQGAIGHDHRAGRQCESARLHGDARRVPSAAKRGRWKRMSYGWH